MSVCFYNTSGSMHGFDIDKYIANVEGAPVDVPLPHDVSIPFTWPKYFWKKRINTVTTDGCPSFQGGMDFYNIIHTPRPLLPPHGNEVIELGLRILTSGSKAWMSVHKVHFGGDKAATCLYDCLGTNQNCGWPLDLIQSNVVLNPNTVVTSPTRGDYVGSYIAAITDILIGGAMGLALGKIGSPEADLLVPQLWRRAPDMTKPLDNDTVQTVTDPPGKVQEVVQQWVDGEPPAKAGKS